MRHPHSTTGRQAPRGGGPGHRGHGPGGADQDIPAADGIEGWFGGRLPEDWFEGPADITTDRDEILVVGRISAPTSPSGDEAAKAESEAGRITRFREETREARMKIAREAEHRYGRKVAWGAQAGDTRQVFTTLSVPVMTRLRQPERQVLDTLVDAGVARSRSEALAWCVKLVGRNADAWLAELRTAMESVQQVRERGPA
ncbi:MAG: hypothetical protein JWP11_1993 [Frankiales bacterium]|jgi:hypothetical protein|nr:hypothetical protein [Frankiales bacterium]